MTKPRIVVLTSSLDVLGGAQRVAHVIADHLAARDYSVDLVGVAPSGTPHDYGTGTGLRRSNLMREEWPTMPVSFGATGRREPSDPGVLAHRDVLSAQAVAALELLLRDGPPGVVVSTQLWAMEHLARAPHDGWSVIGQYHSSIEAAAAGPDLQRALDLYADVDAVAMLTPTDADAMRRAGLNNVTWLPNPLAFWPATPVVGRDGPAGQVTYLGRFAGEKGLAFLVDAWGRVADGFPGWRLRLVGSGPEEAALRQHAAQLPAGGDRVEFHPPVVDAEAELRRSDVVVLPSLTEGMPLALAEAMALGLPCVATDCSSGVRMVTREGRAALLVARGDAAALAQGLSRLMSSPEYRGSLGRAARAAAAPYRASVVIDQWELLIASVLR